MRKKLLSEVATFAYILLFSYAAASKLLDMKMFQAQMSLQPISASWVPYLIWGIPFVEIIIVLILIVPRYRLTGLKLATGLMLVFTGYISLAELGYFKDLPCTCAGIIGRSTWKQHLWFNLVFLVLGMVALLIQFRSRRLKFT